MTTKKLMDRGKDCVLLLLWVGLVSAAACMAVERKAAATQPVGSGATTRPVDARPVSHPAGDANGMAELVLDLPRPAYKETPKDLNTPNLPPPDQRGKRPKFLVPAGCKNVAAGKGVTSSVKETVSGELKCITDGDKEATEGSYVVLGEGTQWVQIDLEEAYRIYAIVIWHYHGVPKVYHDVVVQTSDDQDFIEKVTALFNADYDNSSGLGVGKDRDYIEGFEGKIIDGKGTKGRYVRLYSKGSTTDGLNHYTEVEVYALPGK